LPDRAVLIVASGTARAVRVRWRLGRNAQAADGIGLVESGWDRVRGPPAASTRSVLPDALIYWVEFQ
jgi:hypothetical protein